MKLDPSPPDPQAELLESLRAANLAFVAKSMLSR
jgi:hypothetical protein